MNATETRRYIRCGHCQDYHSSIAEVRECSRTRQAPASQPVAEVPAPRPEPATEGMYRLNGVIFKVQIAVHGNGRPYAKRLVQDGDAWSFEYAPGAIRQLNSTHRLTLEQAKEFGALYGTCCVCGRTLTNEASIEAGIGPICAGKF
ncbi:DUF6011 domain-containing protein [Actinophytocola sp.]|uniref:DUF6011 domain-containing protein n=1 Tax=Actinophytocola sp. TaxID=1872138 RepID=UPI002D808B0D|nr:DUF6011 domain-containing protein [Actinophytocola sp.]HET9144172.1 DUF6011 domain-containing protein [Actinophytocola sp.]